jgi:hypothetical protein
MHTGNTQPKAKAALPSYDKTTRRCRDEEWSRLLEKETRDERYSWSAERQTAMDVKKIQQRSKNKPRINTKKNI